MTALSQARIACSDAYKAYYETPISDNELSMHLREVYRDAQCLVEKLEAAEKRVEYNITVGPDRGYVGINLSSDGSLTFDILNGPHKQGTGVVTNEQAEDFYVQLGRLLGH